jgi:hypothetical protein
MAKRRGRQVSLDGLVARLSALDEERVAIQRRIVGAIRSLGVPSPISFGPSSKGHRRSPGGTKPKGARKRRKMSAEARAKIAAAQRKRWAKQKAGNK